MSPLKMYLFGYPRLELDGQELSLETRKALTLLAYLAVEDQAHSRETLASMFWPELESQRAHTTCAVLCGRSTRPWGKNGWIPAVTRWR